MVVSLERWLQRWLPPGIQADAEAKRRSMLLLWVWALAQGALPLFAALAVFRYRLPVFGLLTLLATALSWLTPLLLRRTGWLGTASAFTIIFFYLGIVSSALALEGVASPALCFLGVLPLFAAAVAGLRPGLLWAAVCAATPLALKGLAEAGVFQPVLLPEPLHAEAAMWNYALLALVVGGLGAVYESIRQGAQRELADAARKLAAAREQQVLHDRVASLSSFASGMAHEMNSPLAVILANSRFLLEEGPSENPELQAAALDAMEAADRLRRLIERLQLQHAGTALEPGSAELEPCLETALKLMPDAVKGRARLSTTFGHLPAVRVPPSQLVHLLHELVVHALQCMPARDPGQNDISLSAMQEGERVVLRLRDNGVGLSDQQRKHVFDPFFSLYAPGLGTGLFGAQAVVSAAGGEIAVESLEGQGAVCRVALPTQPSAGAST